MIGLQQGNMQDQGHTEHCRMPNPRNGHSYRTATVVKFKKIAGTNFTRQNLGQVK